MLFVLSLTGITMLTSINKVYAFTDDATAISKGIVKMSGYSNVLVIKTTDNSYYVYGSDYPFYFMTGFNSKTYMVSLDNNNTLLSYHYYYAVQANNDYLYPATAGSDNLSDTAGRTIVYAKTSVLSATCNSSLGNIQKGTTTIYQGAPDTTKYDQGMNGSNPWVFTRFEYTNTGQLKSYHWSLKDESVYDSQNRRAWYLDTQGYPNLISSTSENVKMYEFTDKVFVTETSYKTSYSTGIKFPVLYSLINADNQNRTLIFKDKASAQKYLSTGEIDPVQLVYETPDYTPDPTVPSYGDQMPNRADYDDDMGGSFAYIVDLIIYFIKMPFKLLEILFANVGIFLSKVTAWFGDTNHGVIGFITKMFSFLPTEVNVAIGGMVSLIAIFSIWKLVRG